MKDKPGMVRRSGNEEWYTPPVFIELAREAMGGIDLDPASSEAANAYVQAAKYYTKEEDGLTQPWEGRVFLNPPLHQKGDCFVCWKISKTLPKGAGIAGHFASQ